MGGVTVLVSQSLRCSGDACALLPCSAPSSHFLVARHRAPPRDSYARRCAQHPSSGDDAGGGEMTASQRGKQRTAAASNGGLAEPAEAARRRRARHAGRVVVRSRRRRRWCRRDDGRCSHRLHPLSDNPQVQPQHADDGEVSTEELGRLQKSVADSAHINDRLESAIELTRQRRAEQLEIEVVRMPLLYCHDLRLCRAHCHCHVVAGLPSSLSASLLSLFLCCPRRCCRCCCRRCCRHCCLHHRHAQDELERRAEDATHAAEDLDEKLKEMQVSLQEREEELRTVRNLKRVVGHDAAPAPDAAAVAASALTRRETDDDSTTASSSLQPAGGAGATVGKKKKEGKNRGGTLFHATASTEIYK